MSDQKGDYWSGKPAPRVEKNSFAEVCAEYLSGSERLLDLGSGRGEDSLHFAKPGCSVTAVDIADMNVEHLKEAAKRAKLKNISVIKYDLSAKFPFDGATFDAVCAHLALHYFDDETTKKIFADVLRVLVPGGWFFVKCKSIDDGLYGQGKKIAKDMYLREHMRHFFSEEYMRECLLGFEIVSLKKSSSQYDDLRSDFVEAMAKKSNKQ